MTVTIHPIVRGYFVHGSYSMLIHMPSPSMSASSSASVRPSVPAFEASVSAPAPLPSLAELMQRILTELTALQRCYERCQQLEQHRHSCLSQPPTAPSLSQSFLPAVQAALPQAWRLNERDIVLLSQIPTQHHQRLTIMNEPINFRPVASQAVLRSLPLLSPERRGEIGDEDCAVCQESLLKARVLELPCQHYFHGHCVERWMAEHNTCPCCRFQLPTDNDHYNEHVVFQQKQAVRKSRRLSANDKAARVTSSHSLCPSVTANERCSLSVHGLECVLPFSTPPTAALRRMSCGHCYHSQCLEIATTLLGLALASCTMIAQSKPTQALSCPLCALPSASSSLSTSSTTFVSASASRSPHTSLPRSRKRCRVVQQSL